MAPRQVSIPVDKYRPGRRTRVRLLILHSAEGARTVESLASFLRRPGINASYHAAADDDKLAYYVNRSNEAWHCRGANPLSDGLCLTGFASWSTAEWMRHPVMLETTAWWLASVARDRGVPLRKLAVAEVGAAIRDPNHTGGVCMHWDYTLATGDGTHWDVGPNFPWGSVLNRAREIQGGSPAQKGLFMHLTESQEHTILAMAEQYVSGLAGVRNAGPVRLELLRTHNMVTEILNLVRQLTGTAQAQAPADSSEAAVDAPAAYHDLGHAATSEEIYNELRDRVEELSTRLDNLRAGQGSSSRSTRTVSE